MTFSTLRRRVPSEVVVQGNFPFVGRQDYTADLADVVNPYTGYYTYHEGDILTGGAGVWALDPSTDTPLSTVWGNGCMRNPWAFGPVPPRPLVASQAGPYEAIRGMMIDGILPERLHKLMGESFSG